VSQMQTSTPVTIRAEFDEEAQVWWISESSYPGLVTEAPSLDALLKRARLVLESLREMNGDGDGRPPVELHAVAA